MNIKKLKERLNEFPDNLDVFVKSEEDGFIAVDLVDDIIVGEYDEYQILLISNKLLIESNDE